MGQFGLYSVGEAVDLNCADTAGSSNVVQWLNSAGAVLASGSTSATLSYSVLTDGHHGTELTCRILAGVVRDSDYTIIVLSK